MEKEEKYNLDQACFIINFQCRQKAVENCTIFHDVGWVWVQYYFVMCVHVHVCVCVRLYP